MTSRLQIVFLDLNKKCAKPLSLSEMIINFDTLIINEFDSIKVFSECLTSTQVDIVFIHGEIDLNLYDFTCPVFLIGDTCSKGPFAYGIYSISRSDLESSLLIPFLRSCDESYKIYLALVLELNKKDSSGNQIRDVNTALAEANVRSTDIMLQLEESRDAAEAATNAKSHFLAIMSHEIRTPINGVIGMTHALKNTQLGEDQLRFVEVIKKCSDMLLGVINDILDFSKIEARKLELEIVPFDLKSLLDDFRDTVSAQIQEKGLLFNTSIQPNVPVALIGDFRRIRQVLNNLVSNAIKFTDEGTISIDISLESQSQDVVTLHFSVADTGIGLLDGNKKKIFASFTQADASTTRKYGGTGLGLAISKHLVELMDGEIGYINNVGEGTSFWFNVKIKKGVPNSPLDEVEEYKANATDKVSDNQKSKYKILIAEDNLINQLVALEILKNLGYQADKASNGEEVLSAIKKVPYDLILMDCQMPIMDGYQATSSIRSKQLLDINSSIPIIAMTAAAMKGDREKCIESGMNDYLTKPIDPLALSEMLNKWL